MDQRTALKITGSMQQLAYTREIIVKDGRADNLRAVEVKNADLRFLVMADKCLDIAYLEYRGMNLSFISKPGLNGRNSYDTRGQEARRSIMGGLLFTCGLQNICDPCETDGVEYPMHGRIRTTPCEHLCADAFWEGDEYVLQVSGEMREAELFGTNLVLRRTIRSVFGSDKLELIDLVENQTSEPAELMLMYHCNFGFPFLRPGTRLVLPSKSVRGREDWSQESLDLWPTMTEPKQGEAEYVFLHELSEDAAGNSFAAIVNDALGFGLKISFDRKAQPYFMEWMSLREGDYVLGIEPSNSSVYGRKYHEQQNTMHLIEPFSTERFSLSFEVLNGEEAIEKLQTERDQLLNKKSSGN